MYSLPVKARTWPASTASLSLSIALRQLVGGEVVGVGAVEHEHEAHRVAHLREQGDLALEVGAGEQLVEAARPPWSAWRCRRCRSGRSARAPSSRGSCPMGGPEGRDQVLVRGWAPSALSSGWSQPSPIICAGHPVGEHHHVAPDRLAVAELVAHLGEELGVVVDVVGVVDLDAGALLEVLERRGLAALLGLGRRCRRGQLEMISFLARRTGPCSCTSAGSCSADGVPKSGEHARRRRSRMPASPAPLEHRASWRDLPAAVGARSAASSRPPGLLVCARSPVTSQNRRPDKGFSAETVNAAKRDPSYGARHGLPRSSGSTLATPTLEPHDERAWPRSRRPRPRGTTCSTTCPSRSSSSSSRTAAGRTPRSARSSGLSEAAVRQRVQRLVRQRGHADRRRHRPARARLRAGRR